MRSKYKIKWNTTGNRNEEGDVYINLLFV